VVAAVTLKNGNLQFTTSSNGLAYSTIGVTSGKWYFEYEQTVNLNFAVGVWGNGGSNMPNNSYPTYYWDIYTTSGTLALEKTSGSASGTLGSVALNDVIGVALDIDNTTLYFYRNGSLIQTITGMTISGPLYPVVTVASGTAAQKEGYINFGQRPFAYTAPSGFKALCTANLPAPLVTKPSTVMDVKLYTGNGGTQAISGLGFSPDFLWFKSRSTGGAGYNNIVFDAVRGSSKSLATDLTVSEYTGTDLTSFNSDGFTVAAPNQWYGVNNSGTSFAAWCWDAGSSTVTNTQGSISSQVRANASAGFSIVTATKSSGSSTAQTFGHGLGVEPHMIILKRRNGSESWYVYNKVLGNAARLQLNETSAVTNGSGVWGSTTPTSQVFTVQSFNDGDFVAYCFAPVAGYSSFGSYTGNGSTDGPFVYTGFRPRWILLKSSTEGVSWIIYDTARNTYNLVNSTLSPNLSSAESAPGVSGGIDILSNGFKLRSNDQWLNFNAATYIYAAFAESPFQYARAR
jgi:hypothetical protein